MEKYILAIDQGTTSSRAIIFDNRGQIAAKAQQEFRQIYPRPGWVEHDPTDLLGSVMSTVAEAVARAGIKYAQIEAIGLTNQRETTLVWDRATGAPVYNAIVWQCRRTAKECEKLKKQGFAERIYNKTGLVPDAYFSATKLQWILDNVEGARARAERGELCFGTVDTFIAWKLSGGKIFATDYTNAARTMLFDIHGLKWDEELLRLFDIPRAMLPDVLPSGRLYGYTDRSVLGAEIPICGMVGDQQAALYGQLCLKAGDAKCTYGTGCFLLMNTGKKAVHSSNGLVTTLAAGLTDRPDYALEGSVFIGGALVQWLRDGLRLISSSEQSEQAALKVADSNGVYVVPAFTGLGAPYWDADARGAVLGLTRGVTAEHIIRASLESIAYQVSDLVNAMAKDAGATLSHLCVDGGASANGFLMQFQSDILDIPVERPPVVETTALGAAYLAGLACGFWNSEEELRSTRRKGASFLPQMEERKRLYLLSGWADAVRRVRSRPGD